MSISISKKIKYIREAEGITQKKLSEILDIGEVTVARYEGATRTPSFEISQKICNAFPQYMEYLMLDEMREPRTPGQITPQEKIHLDSNSQVENA